MKDLVIIGGGPAGVAGAVYAARKQLKTAIVASEFGGQSSVSAEIYNWIGDTSISGTDLASKMKAHTYAYEGEHLEIHEGDTVVLVAPHDDGFVVTTEKGETIPTKTVLVASGSGRRKLDIPGADTYENKGVVYCASCDGPLFSGQDVLVVGGGNAGFETAAQLAAYCSKVTIVHRSDAYKADEITVEKVLSRDNVVGLLNTSPTAIVGEAFVTGATLHNTKTDETTDIAVGGVFVEIGQIPNNDFIDGLVDFDPHGRISVDPKTQRTSVEGIWAAGDITNGLYHQNNIAAGDAVKAIENIYLYLHA